MSELTECCFCHLQWIRKRLKPGERIVIRPVEDGKFRDVMPKAVEVYVVPAGVELPAEGVIPEGPNGAPLHWVAMFGELTEQCAC